jgi:glycosyltransferase involved in cell wall biosynthesis
MSQHIIYYLELASARLASVAVAVGPQTLALYRCAQLVNNGVDTNEFKPGPKSVRPSLLFVGTWSGRKRGQFIYEVFTKFIHPQCSEAELHMVCDQCPPADGVIHVTTPDDKTLSALFRAAWLFVYPSVYEGFGIPYLEAMASNTPVITSPNSGAAYVLRDGELGVIASDEEFGSAVLRLLKDDTERKRMEKAGHEAVNDFTWDKVAAEHVELYYASSPIVAGRV